MKKIFLPLFGVVASIAVMAQDTPLETARSFMRTGDFDNAILVLNNGLKQDPRNTDMKKDLVLAYTYKRLFQSAGDC